jgi:outer membrane protein insertion porin family
VRCSDLAGAGSYHPLALRRGACFAAWLGAVASAVLPAAAQGPDTLRCCTAVEVEGTHAIAAAEVHRILAPPFPADSLEARLRRLGQRYFALGYLAARFEPQPAAHGGLRLRVQEGEPARIAQLYLRGTHVVPEPLVREILALQPGQPFRAEAVAERLAALAEAYARRGHLDAEATLERFELTDTGVVLGVAVEEGERATLAELTVRGNTTTRATLVERLADLRPPLAADAGRIRDAQFLLQRSGLFAEVAPPLLYRVPGTPGGVGAVLRVVEIPRRNRVFGAVGMARDPLRDRPYMTGSIDLMLGNMAGSGRDVGFSWRRDARLGSALAVTYRERFLLGSPLDLDVSLSQTVRDSTSTWQTLGLTGNLPVRRNLSVDLGGAYDRTVFHLGLRGNTQRLRVRCGFQLTSLAREQDGKRFGAFVARGEYARRRNDLAALGVSDRERVDETIWGGRFEAGVPLAPHHVLAARGEWHAVEGVAGPVPVNELFEFGGARTLRGYREAQFRGDRVAFGGLEYRYGNPRGARLYAFLDAGGSRRRVAAGTDEQDGHLGYGMGLRAAVATGTLDLAFGVGDEGGFGAVKLHAALVQNF